MKKGARVIDNIAALKFCRENGIKNSYNFVINYPNEEIIDFEETRKNIQLIKEYIDPPKISPLLIGFGSPIYCNLREFNIEVLEPLNTDKIMFPEKILEKGISFFYSYKKKKDLGENNWNQLVDNWKCEREILAVEGLKKDTSIDKLIFYFLDGENFIKIYDKRDGKNIQIYILDETERKIFLACIDVISIHELQERFPDIPDFKLAAILDTFEQNGIVFHEDDCYLSLPLKCNTRLSHQPVKEELLLVSD